MGRKGEQDLARGSALSQTMVLVWGERGEEGCCAQYTSSDSL